MSWKDELTGTAYDIAATNDSPLRVMAGPGTGKTFALQRRVARLLEEGQNPKRILAVTFTRNAAASLVNDLHSLEIAGSEDVRTGTLHSFCFSLLNRSDVFAYVDRVPRPLVTFSTSGSLQFEGGVLLDDLVYTRKFGGKRQCTKQIKAFEAAWARLQSEAPGWAQEPVDKDFENTLVDWLRFHQSMLIGKLIPQSFRYLRNNPMDPITCAYDYVVVDEYQDLNKAEQTLIDILVSNGNLAIIGDEDQSIYSFRHAHPEGILEFGDQHAVTHDETLDYCRRCPKRVVAMANHLIEHNHPAGGASRLLPMPTNPEGEVHVVQWRDNASEAEGIATFVRSLVQDGLYKPEDILVLTPRRLLGYAFRDVLQANDIRVHSFFHEEVLESAPAQRAFALLNLVAHPDDRVALRWWLGSGSHDGLAGEYHNLRLYCQDNGVPPKQALETIANGDVQVSGVSKLMPKYEDLCRRLSELEDLPLADLIDFVLPEEEEGLEELRDIALISSADADSVQNFFNRMKTYITQPEMPEANDFVRVMSLHKSKGLTCKVVIVLGCVQGLIPGEDREDTTDEERMATLREQRRLFYVALTRCTEVLVLSSSVRIYKKIVYRMGAKVRRWQANFANVVASQFLDELGPDAPSAIAGQAWAAGGYSPKD